jgi:hypothetical protein
MSKQVNTLFSDEQYENLRKVAFYCRTSVAALVRVLATSPSPGHVENIKQRITSNDVNSTSLQDDFAAQPGGAE